MLTLFRVISRLYRRIWPQVSKFSIFGNTFKYYKKLKNEGIDEIDLIEVQCSDDVNTYKDYVRSVCSIVDKHLENGYR